MIRLLCGIIKGDTMSKINVDTAKLATDLAAIL